MKYLSSILARFSTNRAMDEGKLCLEPDNTAQSISSKTVCLYLSVEARCRVRFITLTAAGLVVGAGKYGRHYHWTSNTLTNSCGSIFISCL
jgi:hypothetical protein